MEYGKDHLLDPAALNEPAPRVSTGERIHRALPFVLLGIGALLVMIGLHSAATGLLAVAALHLVPAAVLLVSRRRSTAAQRGRS